MIFDPILDHFRGKAVTIPPLDGAFRPNTLLDDAGVFSDLGEADNLAVSGGRLFASSGNAVYSFAVGCEPEIAARFPAPVTALAVGPGGDLAVALETGKLLIDGVEQALPSIVGCISALAFAADGTLWLANGSADHSIANWSADLMRRGASGSIWKRFPGSAQFSQAASGLAFPYGLLPVNGGVIFSESWKHRLVRLDSATGTQRTVADKLPGYPARLSPATGGGAWLAFFAPRNRLIELVLQETHYRMDMISLVPREFWIAPALSSGRSFLEPLQCGGIKTMGVHKPWSPSRSYGLVVRLGEKLQPLFSYHSRANGHRHGTCSAVELDGRLLVASKGGDCIVDAGPTDIAQQKVH
ncbi:hypothetical protein [Pseudaminobacter soli (ex Li et al. 2025)]|uniref:Strictosidine synthase conserved region domain-containing protein n=1 Tax=Pseudaminobacter soli (ex Li et al. 2025) TaxID=1295366 RepID=A0A2P7SKP2_9HYPH|nr:hypothetical protein [Mesorhizobium soli]PSJ62901.1 hypothetical protein C7I85_04835 [Mesorhizobium soli]